MASLFHGERGREAEGGRVNTYKACIEEECNVCEKVIMLLEFFNEKQTFVMSLYFLQCSACTSIPILACTQGTLNMIETRLLLWDSIGSLLALSKLEDGSQLRRIVNEGLPCNIGANYVLLELSQLESWLPI